MVAVKAGEVKRLLSSPTNYDAYLIYGPDQGLVNERAIQLSKALKEKAGEAEQISILNEDLAQSPERLSLDLKTISMFGERKILRVQAGKDLPLQDLETLLKETPFEADLIIEAGDLKKTAKLRKLFENSQTTAAISCYSDSSNTLHDLATEILEQNNLSIDREAKDLLISRLGADHALSRGEIEKLCLYKAGEKTITIEDINAILGNMSEIAIDNIVSGCLLGNTKQAVDQYKRAIETGINVAPIFLSLLRQLQQLHQGALAINAGQTIHAVAKAQRPPLYFERRDNFIKELNLWKEEHLVRAIEKVQTSMTNARKRNNPALEISELEALLMSLSTFAKSRQK